MSSVLSIRIPRKFKEEMDKLKDIVDWKKELIQFIEQRIKYYKQRLALEEIHKELEKHPILPRGSGVRIIREDRDRN